MRSLGVAIVGLLLSGVMRVSSADDQGDLSGTWKLDSAHSQTIQARKDLVLVIDEQDQNIHIKEIRGPRVKEDVSNFTCNTLGKECAMQDGAGKAEVSVYYNGAALVVLKTHGRRGSSVEKWRLSVPPARDSLIMDIIHIEPKGGDEKLVFSKSQP